MVGCFLGLLASVALLAWTMITRDPLLLWISLGVFGIAILSGIIHLVCALRVRCPLCHGKLLASQRCVRHRKAETSLASYRLRVVKTVLFSGQFRCPYCGERGLCASREEQMGSPSTSRRRTRR